jgi:hypothetical protein
LLQLRPFLPSQCHTIARGFHWLQNIPQQPYPVNMRNIICYNILENGLHYQVRVTLKKNRASERKSSSRGSMPFGQKFPFMFNRQLRL